MSLAPLRFALILLAIWLLLTALLLVPGALRVTGHEMDLIQMMDISYRIMAGDRLHETIMTPLGVLAFAPTVAFLEQGFGPGRAFLLGQSAVVLLSLPAIWWVGMSRLEGRLRLGFGVFAVLVGMALVYGGAQPSILGSMYYNRWAWVFTALIVVLLMVPARAGWRFSLLDGLLIGGLGVVLLLLKATFVIALVPFGLVRLIQLRSGGVFLGVLAAGLAGIALATAVLGVEHWRGYALDLLAVSGNALRPYPGAEFSGLLSSPGTITHTLLLLAAIVVWRKSGMMAAGLALFVLAPGWIYITYQNWGNDPKWLALLGLLLLAMPPKDTARAVWGYPARAVTTVLAVISFVLITPSMVNMASSPVRHIGHESEAFAPIFSDLKRADVQVRIDVAYAPKAELHLPGFEIPASLRDPDAQDAEETGPVLFLGEKLPQCSVRLGLLGWTQKMVDQLGAVEEAVGTRVLAADIYDHLWLFGPFERLPEMPPWSFGTDKGFGDADYVLVPLCPLNPASRARKLEVIEGLGWTLEEVIRSDLFILAKRTG